MPRRSVPPLADDGLPAREAGEWTKDKLYYVERYANTFMTAMAAKRRSAKWSELVYLDLLCGPGRCVIRNTGEIVDGSPLRALNVRPGFDRLFFADASRANIDVLFKRIPAGEAERVQLQVGDCNVLVRDVVKRLSPNGLALAFLDPEGFELHFDTLGVLAKRRVDVVYLFPSGIGIKRALPHFLRTSGEKMDRFWGGKEWRHLPRAHGDGEPSEGERSRIVGEWVGAFRQRVHDKLGLLSDEGSPMITNDRNSPMYHLLFFTKGEFGLSLWQKVRKIEPSGQRGFSFR
jgi:three-Cys-motif partner protein